MKWKKKLCIIGSVILLVYILAVVVSAIKMNSLSFVTYRSKGWGVTLREVHIDFTQNNIYENSYDFSGNLNDHRERTVTPFEKGKIKAVLVFSLFPLWRQNYINETLKDGDQWEMESNDKTVYGSNAYPFTYWMVHGMLYHLFPSPHGKASNKEIPKKIETTHTPTEPEPTNEATNSNVGYVFFDPAVQKSVELYFDKSTQDLLPQDFEMLSKMDYFLVEEPIKTLKDIPILFPNLKYLNINCVDVLSRANWDILRNIQTLKALTLSSPPIDPLDFTGNYNYFEIEYTQEQSALPENNLLSFSVVGEDFIRKNIEGNPVKLTRVVKGNDIYELVLTDKIKESEFYELPERKIFITTKKNSINAPIQILDATEKIGNYAENQLFFADVNFDGQMDLLVDNGHFGNQGLVTFVCFLNKNGKYERNESFAVIANPSIDRVHQTILSSWRNWAASHSWAMYRLIDSEYVMTDCLTEELVRQSLDDSESNEEVWEYTIETRLNGKMEVQEVFTTENFSTEQIEEKIYNENSMWGLRSNKWNTLWNGGKMIDFSIYGNNNINETILNAINDGIKN